MKFKFNKIILILAALVSVFGGLMFASARVESRVAPTSSDTFYSVDNLMLDYINTSSGRVKLHRKKVRGMKENGAHLDAYCLARQKTAPADSTASGSGGTKYTKSGNGTKDMLYAMEFDAGQSDSNLEYYIRSMGVHYAKGEYHVTLGKNSSVTGTAATKSKQIARNIDSGNYKTTQDVSISLSPGSINMTQNGSNYESNWININISKPSGLEYSPILKSSTVTLSGAPSGTQVIRNNGSVASGNNIGADTRFWIRVPVSSVTGSMKITASVKSTFEVGQAIVYNASTAYQPMAVRCTTDKTVTSASISSNTVVGGGNVTIVKKGDDGKVLSGAKFQLKSSSGTTTAVQTTGSDGKTTFSNLPAGTYTLVETEAPWGYIKASNSTVSITSGKTTTVNVVNARAKGNFKVIKRDEYGNPLPGAKFQLQLGSTVAAGPFTTNSNGEVTFTNMPIGGYSLVEVSAPTGHVIDPNQNHKIIEVEHNKTTSEIVVNKIARGHIKVKKLDSLDDRALSGAEFKLYDSNGSHVSTAVTDASGVATFNNVKYGNYTVKETKAPTGYLINPAVTSVSVTTDGQTYNKTVYDNRKRDFSVPAYNVKDTSGTMVGTLKKDKTYNLNVEIKNSYLGVSLPSNPVLGTPNIDKIKYAVAVNDGTIGQSLSSITTSNIKGTVIASNTSNPKTNVPIKDMSSIWEKIQFTVPNNDVYTELVFVVEVESSIDQDTSNNRLVAKLPITNERVDTISIVNMEVYPNKTGDAIVGNDVNVKLDVISDSIKSYDVNSKITIQGPSGFGTKTITKPVYGVSLETPGSVYFKFKPTVVGSYKISAKADIPGSSSTSGPQTIQVVYPSAPSAYSNEQLRTQVSYDEASQIKTYIKVKKRDKDKIIQDPCDSPCQKDDVTSQTKCPNHQIWSWGDWYNAFVPRKTTTMTGITESFKITELKFRSKLTENNASKYPLYIGSDGYVNMLDSNSAKYAQVKAGYGFDVKVKTEYTNNLPSIFNKATTSNTVPSNKNWSQYQVISHSGTLPFIYADTTSKNVDAQVASYSGAVSVAVPSLSDLIIESPNQLYMKLPDGSNEYYQVDEKYGQTFSDNRIKQRLYRTDSTGVNLTSSKYSEVKMFEIKKGNTNGIDKRGYYIGQNVKDGVNVISFYNRYAGYGLKKTTRLHDKKDIAVKIHGGRYDDLKGTSE